MPGTQKGGKQAANTIKKKYGPDFYRRIGSLGGQRSTGGGFAYDDRTWLQKLTGKPSRAQLAGRRGGMASRRLS